MRTSILFLATAAGFVAAQAASNATDSTLCASDCIDQVDQQFPDSDVIKKCEVIDDAVQELACLCQSGELVGAFQACVGKTCPALALAQAGSAQVICARASASASLATTSASASLATTSTASAAPSGAPATQGSAGNAPGSRNDAANGASVSNGVALANVLLAAAVILAGGLFI